MDVFDPRTWIDGRQHPRFAGRPFLPSYYDGDIDTDLALLRGAAAAVQSRFAEVAVELVVLDDGTMFCKLSRRSRLVAELCPAPDGQLYLDFDNFIDDEKPYAAEKECWCDDVPAALAILERMLRASDE